MTLQQRVERMWWSTARPPVWLIAISRLYAGMSRLHLRQRQRRAHTLSVPLISVGNITVGGSGKTPFVLWLVRALQRKGYAPVILCRGDGGRGQGVCQVDADSNPLEVGDEACVLARMSQSPVVSARDRVAGAKLAESLGDIVILDDGFQYQQLVRNCDIVLVPSCGLGNGQLIPAGPMREPVSQLARADIVVRSGADAVAPIKTNLRQWRWQAEAGALEDVMQRQLLWSGDAACVLTGIARPERFLADVRAQGIEIRQRLLFPDHYRFVRKDIQPLLATDLPVVTTMKDAVKLVAIWPENRPLWVLMQQYRAEPGLLEAIMRHFAIDCRMDAGLLG